MKDLSFLSPLTGTQVVPLKLTGVNSGESTVFQKLLLFLCSSSDGLHLGTSANFPSLLAGSNLRDEMATRQRLNLALSEAVAAIKTAQQGSDLSDADRLAAASISSLSIVADVLSFTISMSTYASESTWSVTNKL